MVLLFATVAYKIFCRDYFALISDAKNMFTIIHSNLSLAQFSNVSARNALLEDAYKATIIHIYFHFITQGIGIKLAT